MAKVPISDRALLARINRKLAKKMQTLRQCRAGSRWYHELGDYYILDLNRNWIVDKHCDAETLGREIGVLREYEVLAKE